MQDSNPEDFEIQNASKMDANLAVRFFLKEVADKEASAEQGVACFKDAEYCEIRIAGNPFPQVSRPARYDDKRRFPKHYEAFLKRTEMPEEGTPLGKWPQITGAQVEQLSFLGIKTVENLANLADTHTHKIHAGGNLKRRAQEWLESSGDSKLLAEKEQLQTRLNIMEEQMATLLAAKTKLAPVAPTEVVETPAEKAPAETQQKPRRRRSTPTKD